MSNGFHDRHLKLRTHQTRDSRALIAQLFDERQELGFTFGNCRVPPPAARAPQLPPNRTRRPKKGPSRLEFASCVPIISSRTGRVLIALPANPQQQTLRSVNHEDSSSS